MDEPLKQLLDYTKFHIGMYVTLTTLLIGVLTSDKVTLVKTSYAYWLAATLLCFLAAGAAGALVASSAPDFASYKDMMDARIGPWDKELINARLVVHLEHTFFWLGIAAATVGLFWTQSLGPVKS